MAVIVGWKPRDRAGQICGYDAAMPPLMHPMHTKPMDDRLTIDPAQAADGVAAASLDSSSARGPGSRVFVKTFGCQMNVYDSERITEALAANGYMETGAIEDADLIILNTCHIREKAAEKVYSDLGRVRDLKMERAAAGRDTLVAVV